MRVKILSHPFITKNTGDLMDKTVVGAKVVVKETGATAIIKSFISDGETVITVWVELSNGSLQRLEPCEIQYA